MDLPPTGSIIVRMIWEGSATLDRRVLSGTASCSRPTAVESPSALASGFPLKANEIVEVSIKPGRIKVAASFQILKSDADKCPPSVPPSVWLQTGPPPSHWPIEALLWRSGRSKPIAHTWHSLRCSAYGAGKSLRIRTNIQYDSEITTGRLIPPNSGNSPPAFWNELKHTRLLRMDTPLP
jgi:hypothetical protein